MTSPLPYFSFSLKLSKYPAPDVGRHCGAYLDKESEMDDAGQTICSRCQKSGDVKLAKRSSIDAQASPCPSW